MTQSGGGREGGEGERGREGEREREREQERSVFVSLSLDQVDVNFYQ